LVGPIDRDVDDDEPEGARSGVLQAMSPPGPIHDDIAGSDRDRDSVDHHRSRAVDDHVGLLVVFMRVLADGAPGRDDDEVDELGARRPVADEDARGRDLSFALVSDDRVEGGMGEGEVLRRLGQSSDLAVDGKCRLRLSIRSAS
jgi:hypothetical protein